MRADAEGLFVRVDHLPEAAIGDAVEIVGHDGGDDRTGMIVATVYHDETAFFRLVLDAVG